MTGKGPAGLISTRINRVSRYDQNRDECQFFVDNNLLNLYMCNFKLSGNNSVVECNLAKVEVAGSNPVSRSIFLAA